MSQAFKNALASQDGRRMLLELKSYAFRLQEPYAIGALHLVAWMELKATELERAKWRPETAPEAKGRVRATRSES